MPSYFASPRLQSPQVQGAQPKTPSPNYFGFQASNESAEFLTGGHHSKKNFSPPSSTVRSTAAASPSIVPVDQNPNYDAFRRQSEGRGAFNLGGLGGNFKMNSPLGVKTKHDRTGSKTSPQCGSSKAASEPRDMPPPARPRTGSTQLDPSSAELSRSPKRMLSPGAAQLEPERKGSPAYFNGPDHERTQSQPRFKLPLESAQAPPNWTKVARAETLPASPVPDSAGDQMVTPQHVVNLIDSHYEGILILDLRVSTQYAISHIVGSLNLCIPTTLLKRPSFNVQKLAETFKDDEQRSRFENWRNSNYIIVYDAASAQLKDAQICINTVKKFRGEGYEGALYIVKGGFADFSRRFPGYTESGVDIAASSSQHLGDGGARPEIAPVIGGCPMPINDKPANPFFGNIRQNMDLIGGVGQIPLKHPQKETKSAEEDFPGWLRNAADISDEGKRVSRKFEAIERREKKRMEDALSGQVSYGEAEPRAEKTVNGIQIAGLEKGTKNRYNNIWPFEHSRVKLQGVSRSGCDYFNANYVQAAWSHKRYISTQAPIPATLNDFWNVIWQQDVRVIVMLTAEKEGAQVKAHNYWDQKQYGPLRLEFLSEKRASLEPSRIHRHQRDKRPGMQKRSSTQSSHPQIPLATIDSSEANKAAGSGEQQPYVVVRKFTLSHEKYPFEKMREITQLQYSSWPDFGAPAHPTHLLGLVEQTDAVVRATNKTFSSKEPEPEGERPIVVHCSAGCGRTGTFCTVDSVIDMLKRQRLFKHQDKSRGASPMDLDNPDPARRSMSHSKLDSGLDTRAERKKSGGGFFASQCKDTYEDYASHGPEGEWVKSDDIDLVEKTVEDFRHQRLSMVQSLRQFVLCYECVMEWIVDHRHSPSVVENGA
ncbi:hypothetical protein EJ03DRAFT_344460 [Teratosphaeria nubilosa]|uniref:protein-tyrosine-phosphatase n=1 Tax=Teratosphaeria nubilosa TaxID=161662 RepID=A0A6G1L402_9PEZI|nr:hypothetical protein EJ03DRAFT_344460 [Teratosphaeria nubilosa]